MSRRVLVNVEWHSPEGYFDTLQLVRREDGELELYVGRFEGDSVTLSPEVARQLRDALAGELA